MPDPTPSWRPTVEEVARAIASRTYTNDGPGEESEEPLDNVVGGALGGTFDENTRPQADDVEKHIDNACTDVLGLFASGEVPKASEAQAKRTATVKAALAIELAAFEAGSADRSPYLQLRIEADSAERALTVGAQVRDLFGEEPAA